MNRRALLLNAVWFVLAGLMIQVGRHDLALWMLVLVVVGLLIVDAGADHE